MFTWLCPLTYDTGQNTYYELGLGDNANKSTPVRVPALEDCEVVVCGLSRAMGVLRGGRALLSWGGNLGGEAGFDSATKRITVPQQVDLSRFLTEGVRIKVSQ